MAMAMAVRRCTAAACTPRAGRRARRHGSGAAGGAGAPAAGTVRDEWGDDAFARAWTRDGGVTRTNPDRERQLRLLAGMVAGRHSAGDLALSLGCGSGLCSAAVLGQLRRAGVAADAAAPAIVGVDASAAMLGLAREIAGPGLAAFKCTFGALRGLDGAHGLLAFAFGGGEAAGYLARRLREPRPFASAFSVQALHEAPDDEKLDACRFAHRHLRAGAPLYVLDRFVLDRASPLVPEYRAMYEASCEDTFSRGRGAGDSRREVMGWEDYVSKYLGAKLDDASTEGAYVEMLREAGFARVEVPYRYFNRSLIVAWKAA